MIETLAERRLSPLLQRLVDERLDGIDRALRQSGSGRAERRQIVEEVERQFWDTLPEHAEPTRREVLTALSKLDPPEAYLPEEPTFRPRGERDRNTEREPARESMSAPALTMPTPAPTSVLAIVSTVLAGIGVVLLPTLVLPIIPLTAAFICAVIAAVQIHQSKGRLGGAAWAATGLALSTLMLLETMAFGLLVLTDSDEIMIIAGFVKALIVAGLAVWPLRNWLKGCPNPYG